MNGSSSRVVLCPLLLLTAAPSAGCQATEARPMDAVSAILDAFDDHPLVALGEMHAMQEEHDLIQALLRDPSLPAKTDAIVLEGANALYQDLLDEFALNGGVSLADVRVVWRNSSQSPNPVWDASVFEQIYETVRDVNDGLPRSQRIRLVAGGLPIDWSEVETAEDMRKYMMSRDRYYASVVEKEVLGRGQKALLIVGGMHLLHAGGRSTVTRRLEARHPGTVFVVWPHAGLLGADMDREHLPEAGKAARRPGRMTTAALEQRLASWPVPSITPVGGTWLGDLELDLFLPGGFRFGGEYVSPAQEYGGLTLSDGIDAYLYLGPRNSLTVSGVSPVVLRDQPYLEELDRRSQLRFGRPFDRRLLIPHRRRYFAYDDGSEQGAKP